MDKRSILITGASGFIGSFLTEEALRREYEVYVTVRKTSRLDFLKDASLHLVETDFSDALKLEETILKLPPFDAVVHNAGITRAVKKSDFMTVNYDFTKNLVSSLLLLDRVPSTFLYMSSLAAFGPADGNGMVDQWKEPSPLTTYGQSKLFTEQYLKSLNGFPYLIVRPTAVYGPREKDFLNYFSLLNKNMELFIGNTPQQLTFIYVKDLTRAVMDLLETKQTGKEYFISDGNTYSRNAMGQTIKAVMNKKTVQIRIPLMLAKGVALFSEWGARLSGNPSLLNREKILEMQSSNWNCDVQPLKEAIGFEAAYPLEKGIHETYHWYKANGWL